MFGEKQADIILLDGYITMMMIFALVLVQLLFFFCSILEAPADGYHDRRIESLLLVGFRTNSFSVEHVVSTCTGRYVGS